MGGHPAQPRPGPAAGRLGAPCSAAARSPGIGFTVALLIATRAFHGEQLAEAKLGALSAAVVAVRADLAGVPAHRAAVAGRDGPGPCSATPALIQDLIPEVDPERDHVRGPADASITIIEFGDFECPYCGQAEPVVRELLTDTDVRYVWRHLPLTDVHPQAQLAAEAAEAAGRAGRVLGDARPAAARTRTTCGPPTWCGTPASSASTSTGSTTT